MKRSRELSITHFEQEERSLELTDCEFIAVLSTEDEDLAAIISSSSVSISFRLEYN